MLLIFWNLDAFLVHTLDEASGLLEIQRVDNWHIRIAATQGSRALEVLYYLAKLDHLWCVPALVLLYAGLRRLAVDAGRQPEKGPANHDRVVHTDSVSWIFLARF